MSLPPESNTPYQRRVFAPLPGNVERRNSKTTYVVDREGRITEHVSLVVNDPRRREELILRHFLRNHGRCFAEAPCGVNILGRDCPWDFDIELSDGPRFFVEITAIADGQQQFEMMKREERLAIARQQPELRLRDLKKLAWMFPDPALDEVLTAHTEQGMCLDATIANPIFGQDAPLLMGHLAPPAQPLVTRMVHAIQEKDGKKHDGGDRTILILDDQGYCHDAADIDAIMDDIADVIAAARFPEIWVYVGYFSDDDGNNAEFSLKPLKLPMAKWEALSRFAEKQGVDDRGRVIW